MLNKKITSIGWLNKKGRFNSHLPHFTKHRKNKGQFKRKQNHWSKI
tara:strand:- start:76 stop:213 length:138 start_codon:yes stop_codon:yes gene_type:complete